MSTKFKAKHAARLLELADFLETVDESTFDLGVVAESREYGFVGCAMGWAGRIPHFRRLGFKTESVDGPGCFLGNETLGVSYQDSSDAFEASQAFFGLDEYEADYLFMPRNDENFMYTPYRSKKPKAKTVAGVIRKFVAKKQKEGPCPQKQS